MNRRRILPRAAAMLAVCAALVLAACTSSGSNPNEFRFRSFQGNGTLMPAAQRKAAQDVGGELLAGGSTTLHEATAGHVAVVNFWASWCGPCQVETPQFALLAKETKPKGVDFLGIDTSDTKENATTFLAHSGVTYPIVFDQPGKIALQLGNIPANLPFTVLVDKQGKVAAVYKGLQTAPDLRAPINTLLAER